MSSIPCVFYDKGFIFKNSIFIRKSLKQAIRKKNPTEKIVLKVYDTITVRFVVTVVTYINGWIVNRLNGRWNRCGCGRRRLFF